MSNRAWVTLATNDSYGLGALVLAHSLRRNGSTFPAVVLITPSVTDAMRDRLSAVFSEVITVDVLDSKDATHLALLQRPELGITFTKIHCWNLTQYEKCVFLDADTLVVQNCDELFEREELSAAPDVGWPDCFNSGVFVFKPSAETFSRLVTFAKDRGSFDGGDQGLLNSFFSEWARGDINNHLPFLYNVTSAAFYSYIPALKHYGQNLKIIHFIGATKPWLQQYNWNSKSVNAPDHLKEFLQLWWDIFVGQVHQQLDTTMTGVAGNLARVSASPVDAQREAIDELARRQGWEAGNIDYMGADSFDNIWAKISETLNQPRASPPKEPEAPPACKEQVAPAVEPSSQPVEVAVDAASDPISTQNEQLQTPIASEAIQEDAKTAEGIQIIKSPSELAVTESKPVEPEVKAKAIQEIETAVEIKEAPIAELAPKQSEAPQVAKKPQITNPPKTVDEPKPLEALGLAETPKLADVSVPIEPPKITEIPQSADESKSVEVPKPAKVSGPTEAPKIAEVPKPAEEPNIAEVANLAEVAKLAEAAKVAEVQKPTEAPMSEEVPKPSEVLMSVNAPRPVAVPMTTEVPKLVEAPKTLEAPKAVEAIKPVTAPKSSEAPKPKHPSSPKEEVKKTEPLAVPPTPPTSPKNLTPEQDSSSESSIPEPVKIAEASLASDIAKEALVLLQGSDSPPLANTPSKEEAPSAPAAKSEEKRRPAGKLRLSPPQNAPALLTPDSEAEDAASLAHAIIAGELTPQPPDSATTPTAATSLAQIGVKSKSKPSTADCIETSVSEVKQSEPPKKKVIKKVVKKDATGTDAPVPPPRKKEKKPKDK